jgi:aminoglycoside phosphotransferase (APT) family kinase protein
VPEWSAEVTVDADLARRLIAEQFPELALDSLRLLGEGWDTTVWLVDDEWAFRFPRRQYVIAGIENEMALLPQLEPLLPLPIPNPTFQGRPSEAYRWPFYGAPFLPGRELAEAGLDDEDRLRLAAPLADFLRALHSLDLDAELPVDPVRRADMAFRVPRTRERLEELADRGLWSRPPFVDDLLADAEGLPVPAPTAVVHGDLHIRHLLVGDGGDPTAVIDWIDLSRSDPAVDLVLYWCALPPAGRATFLAAYGSVGEEQLLRARVLALFLCGTLAVYGQTESLATLMREAVAGLDRTCNPEE